MRCDIPSISSNHGCCLFTRTYRTGILNRHGSFWFDLISWCVCLAGWLAVGLRKRIEKKDDVSGKDEARARTSHSQCYTPESNSIRRSIDIVINERNKNKWLNPRYPSLSSSVGFGKKLFDRFLILGHVAVDGSREARQGDRVTEAESKCPSSGIERTEVCVCQSFWMVDLTCQISLDLLGPSQDGRRVELSLWSRNQQRKKSRCVEIGRLSVAWDLSTRFELSWTKRKDRWE